MSATASTCRGSPEWLAHISATCAREKPKRSGPPAAVNGSACSGFSALRVNVRVYGSPAAFSTCPARSTTATAPKWTLSTAWPRRTSARGAYAGTAVASGIRSVAGKPTLSHPPLELLPGERGPHLLERSRILDRREVAGVARLGERLDRAAQKLSRARLRQHRHEMHARRPRDRAQLAVDRLLHFAGHRLGRLCVGDPRRVLDDGERDRHLPFHVV